LGPQFALPTPDDHSDVNTHLSYFNMKHAGRPVHDSDGRSLFASPHVTRPVARPLSCSVEGVLEGHWRNAVLIETADNESIPQVSGPDESLLE